MKIHPGATLEAIMARSENYRTRVPRDGFPWIGALAAVCNVAVFVFLTWQMFHPSRGLIRCEDNGSVTMMHIDFWNLDTRNETEIARRLLLALCARGS